ncbi:MAG: hypothetical protein ACOCSE_03190, partial [Chitinivibrionales bacterium]
MINNRGYTIIHVVTALILTTAVGTTLVTMAHKDKMSSQNYADVLNAELAAKTALDDAELFFRNNPDTSLQILLNYLDSSDTETEWLLDTSHSDAAKTEVIKTMSNKCRYSARIAHVDSTGLSSRGTMLARIKGIGYGTGNSRAEVTGMYELGNLEYATDTVSGINDIAALEMGSDFSHLNERIEITGPLKIGGDFYLNSSADSSVFRGPVWIEGNFTNIDASMVFQQNVYVEGLGWGGGDYLDNPQLFRSSLGMEDRLYVDGCRVSINENLYCNDGWRTRNSNGEIRGGDTFYFWGTQEAVSGSNGVTGFSSSQNQYTPDLPDVLNMPQGNISVNIDTIPDSAKYSWTDIVAENTSATAGTFESAYSSQTLWNDFLVVEMNSGDASRKVASNPGEFSNGKYIWLINDGLSTICDNKKWFGNSTMDGSCVQFIWTDEEIPSDFGPSGTYYSGFMGFEGVGSDQQSFKSHLSDSIQGAVWVPNDGIHINSGGSDIYLNLDMDCLQPFVDVGLITGDSTSPS